MANKPLKSEPSTPPPVAEKKPPTAEMRKFNVRRKGSDGFVLPLQHDTLVTGLPTLALLQLAGLLNPIAGNPGTDGHSRKRCGSPVNLQRFQSSIVHDIKSGSGAGGFLSMTMIAPKNWEPDGTASPSAGKGADCLDLVKLFGSRILRLAKYITESDADAEDVLVETFLIACADGSGSRADEGVRARLATIAVREALAKRCHRGHAEGEDQLCEDVVIREIFVWGDNYRHYHSPEQTAEMLEQAMWSLDPICRAVFVLRDIEEIPVEEAALVLNRSVAALRACLLKARLQLRERLARTFRQALPSIGEASLGDHPV